MDKEVLIEYLDERFRPVGGSTSRVWQVHTWEYYGLSYGLEVTLYDNSWQLRQLVDSGYSEGRVLETHPQKIYDLVSVLMPTVADYKFDRK